MLVRTKLWLAGGAIVTLAVVLPVVFILTGEVALRQINKDSFVDEFSRGVYEMTVVLGDYVSDPNERAERQWQERYAEVASLFDVPVTWSEEEQLLLDVVRADYNALGALLGQLVEVTPAPDASDEDSQKRDRLAGQISVRSTSLITNTSALGDQTRSALQNSITSARPAVAALSLILLATGVGLVLIFRRSLARPLGSLTELAKAVASGQYSAKIDPRVLASKDELGLLARTVTKMSNTLLAEPKRLETEVKRRTVELSKAHLESEKQAQELSRAQEASLNIMEDLNEEKARLAEAKARDDAILEGIGDGVVMTDINKQVVLVNHATEKMVQFTADALLGKVWPDVVSPVQEDGTRIKKNEWVHNRVLSQPKSTRVVSSAYFYTRKDGTTFPVDLTASQVWVGDEMIGVVVVFRDISQERAIDKAKTEFVSLASHQLRTPLSTINWYAEMLKAGDAGELTKEQNEYVNEIYVSNQRMVDLVNALLDTSRIDLGTFSIEPELTDLVKLAQETIKEQEPEVFKRRQNLEEKYDELPEVLLDQKLMKIVIQNLVSNAIKYTPEEGSVTVSLKKVGDAIQLEVTDTGYGIPKDQQEKIFSKLFRADNVKEMDTTGTGLGLYLAKSIVENSGGKIWFESEVDKGTTFFVTLPLSGMKAREGSKRLGE